MTKQATKPETALIEFSVQNYRSIKDPLTLSFVAGKSRTNTFYVPPLDTHLLRSIAIYGANSSGKSNVIWSLFLMRQLVLGAKSLTEVKGLKPFLLDDTTRDHPTVFDIHLVHKDHTYAYHLELDALKRIVVRERLRVILPKATSSRASLIFDRKLNEVAISSNLPSDVHGISRMMTKTLASNQVFIAVLSQLEAWNIAHDLSDALTNISIYNTDAHEKALWETIVQMLYEAQLENETSMKGDLLDMLARADLSIVDLEVRKLGDDNLELYFGHRYLQDDGSFALAYFAIDDESEGTRKFFSLLMPFFFSLQQGAPMILDELDSNLHPVLLRFILELYNSSDSNAQLLLTSHDVNLMDNRSLLTKDQIYFIEKKQNHSSTAYGLSEFPSIRNNTPNLSKRYLAGEFGARADITE